MIGFGGGMGLDLDPDYDFDWAAEWSCTRCAGCLPPVFLGGAPGRFRATVKREDGPLAEPPAALDL